MKKEKKHEEEEKKKESTCQCEKEGKTCTCEKKDSSKEIDALQQTIQQLQEKLMYKEADFINYRKRKDEETANLLKFANQDLILDIINSVDNFERAIEAIKKDDEKDNQKILAGIDMIYQELKNTLKKYGVEEISAVDVPFDENVHHAVATGNDSSKEEGIVLEVMAKGYSLKGRIIRPAMVKVNQL